MFDFTAYFEGYLDSRQDSKTSCNMKNKNEGKNCCNRCGKIYKHAAHLRHHINYECGHPKRFQCPYCNHKSKRRSDLCQHVRAIHPGLNVYALELIFSSDVK